MYSEQCAGCGKKIEIDFKYEPEWCCSGYECGCQGLPINPLLC